MIYTVKPYAPNKTKFGEVYNAHCAMVPDGNWILVMDSDCMLTVPQVAYRLMEIAIDKYPDTAIFGAVTNRVGYKEQCYLEEISEDDRYLNHKQLGLALAVQWWMGECRPILSVAGFFLLFRKEYWEASPFQAEIINKDGLCFDRAFCLHAKANRMKMRIIRGVYVFHDYRMGNDIYDKKHLLP